MIKIFDDADIPHTRHIHVRKRLDARQFEDNHAVHLAKEDVRNLIAKLIADNTELVKLTLFAPGGMFGNKSVASIDADIVVFTYNEFVEAIQRAYLQGCASAQGFKEVK